MSACRRPTLVTIYLAIHSVLCAAVILRGKPGKVRKYKSYAFEASGLTGLGIKPSSYKTEALFCFFFSPHLPLIFSAFASWLVIQRNEMYRHLNDLIFILVSVQMENSTCAIVIN